MLWRAGRKGGVPLKQKAKLDIRKTALGALLALALYLMVLAVMSLLLVRGAVREDKIGVLTAIATFLSALAGAKAASWREGERLTPILCCSLLLLGAILLCGFWTNDAVDPTRAAKTAAVILLGGVCAYALHGKERTKGRRRRRGGK